MTPLRGLVPAAARRTPRAPAVAGPDGTLTYRELDREADRIGRALASLGVRRGDRVGLWLDKSAVAVAAMQGVLRLGAAYVPLDPLSPPARVARILRGCGAAALVTAPGREPGVPIPLLRTGPGWDLVERQSADPLPDPGTGPDDLAYILYTSGSTGEPKGVCVSDRNAMAFVEWAAAELRAVPSDRFANHAPFHFDLSVLDLYAAFHAGASVHLVPQAAAYAPARLVEFLTGRGITVWYSVPSALILMMRDGGLLDAAAPGLRALLFAGEPFPVRYLRPLRDRFADVRLLNLYGPTETNVCTFHEVTGPIPADRTAPVPIGAACSGDRVWARLPGGGAAAPGQVGELMVSGPTVMIGYWGGEPQGDAPYATGDIVRVLPGGAFEYVGRRDALVKVRGNRIELGEIESVLLAHPSVGEAAVVVAGSGLDAVLVAFLTGSAGPPPGWLETKGWCARHLPRHMIVDRVVALPGLPRTGTGKIDRRALQDRAAPA
ncbi:amino acid adenylation domain-containing protein [Actinomadura sp. GTD37]|uniref:amino acid adenylation domain-containing protein n=1 Tax=Actinomadura sp. GTD37 TaxID=1778030 RepID=UPI0035C172F9